MCSIIASNLLYFLIFTIFNKDIKFPILLTSVISPTPRNRQNPLTNGSTRALSPPVTTSGKSHCQLRFTPALCLSVFRPAKFSLWTRVKKMLGRARRSCSMRTDSLTRQQSPVWNGCPLKSLCSPLHILAEISMYILSHLLRHLFYLFSFIMNNYTLPKWLQITNSSNKCVLFLIFLFNNLF